MSWPTSLLRGRLVAAAALAATTTAPTLGLVGSVPAHSAFPRGLGGATAIMATTTLLAAGAVASVGAAPSAEVPDRLRLGPALQSYPWSDVVLREVDVSTNPVTESADSKLLPSVAAGHSGTVGSVAFVVRRPG
jgi:hypothetical protein